MMHCCTIKCGNTKSNLHYEIIKKLREWLLPKLSLKLTSYMQKQYPFYIKSTVILLGLCLFIYILFTLHYILVPLCFAGLIAVLLTPMVNRLNRWKINNVVSIALAIIFAIVVTVGIAYFLSSQVANFTDDLPTIKKRSEEMASQFQKMLRNTAGIKMQQQNKYLSDLQEKLKPILGQTVGSALSILNDLILLPVYTFLILFYRALIVNFLYDTFKTSANKIGSVLSQTNEAIKSYMVGLLLEALVVAILNTVALLILGVKYALLLGIIGAILNMLPYIGGLVAIILPVMISLITKDSYSTPLLIIGAYLLIQFIDNHFLVPFLVSSKVKINALISIVIVLLGGTLWGVSGMFLSIPFIGILKIIFDRVDDLKPWGKLLGDEMPSESKHSFAYHRKTKKTLADEIIS